MENSIEVYEYSKAKLFELFEKNPTTSKELVSNKNHSEYFNSYLKSEDMGAKTIVVENDYIDRDFLEDFSAYYVRCFTTYERKCTRLHFFSNKFLQDQFDSFLENFDQDFKEDLENNYLGFIVLKPLPQTIIGRTCLRTYKEKMEPGDKRVYPIVRNNEVNLCGIDLTVKSLAFQEQDAVVSACATSALWSAFQGTAMLFQHRILSPVEITKSATKHFPLEERPFPNKGLNLEQMMHAVQELGMEPFLVNLENNEFILKNYVYSYLTYGIPIILVIDLYNIDTEIEDNWEGSHAVVITGYRSESKAEAVSPTDNLRLVASNMSRIYVHDDQIGPFAKMKTNAEKIKIINSESKRIDAITLETEWRFRAVPKIILIPLYPKIRIPLENILKIIEIFDSIICNAIDNVEDAMLYVDKLEWDIFLTSVNKFKKEILQKSGEIGNFKDILKKNMPRFIWRAKALSQEKPVMDLLFDATDIEQGHLFLCGVVYNQELFSVIRVIITSDERISEYLKIHPAGKSLVEWISNWQG